MEDENGGLFNIEVSSEDETKTESEKVSRDFQSEGDFKRQRAEWKPKIEVGEVRICLLFGFCVSFGQMKLRTDATAMENLEVARRQPFKTGISDYPARN